jgi:hypothetical protein
MRIFLWDLLSQHTTQSFCSSAQDLDDQADVLKRLRGGCRNNAGWGIEVHLRAYT